MKSQSVPKWFLVVSICVVLLCSCNDSISTPRVGSRTSRGGYVFYDKGEYSDGWRYLEVAPAGWFGSVSDPIGKFTSVNGYLGKTSTEMGTGRENTEGLVYTLDKECEAAYACYHYSLTVKGERYDDWFLPSYEELVKIKTNLYEKGLGGFSNDIYWSSSEYLDEENNKAVGVLFNNGSLIYVYNWYRDTSYRIRPVRRF